MSRHPLLTDDLAAIVSAALEGRTPERWERTRGRVRAEEVAIRQALPSTHIYGVTTGVGHFDGAWTPDGSISQALIDDHAEAATSTGAPHSSTVYARLALAWKAQQFSLGHTGVSEPTYVAYLNRCREVAFRPALRVTGSYSSGDVLVGAQLAKAVLPEHHQPGPVDGIACINGSFAALAAGTDALTKLGLLWDRSLQAWALSAVAHGTRSFEHSLAAPLRTFARLDPAALHARLEPFLRASPIRPSTEPVQPAVSVRMGLEALDTYGAAAWELVDELNRRVHEPSGNPLFVVAGNDVDVLTQASFLVPLLSLRCSALIESSLLLAEVAAHRTSTYLRDRSSAFHPMATADSRPAFRYVQVAKASAGMLSAARLRAGSRLLGASGATSGGIEDEWALTLHGFSVLDSITAAAIDIVDREIAFVAALMGECGSGLTGALARTLPVPLDLDMGEMAFADAVRALDEDTQRALEQTTRSASGWFRATSFGTLRGTAAPPS